MKQKKALQVTLIIFILALTQSQLTWYGITPFFSGLTWLIVFSGLSSISFIALIIQFIVYLATKKKK
ncbi:MAG: hypothetical protein F2587_04810 [Actinobacteria bacterium]|uniref:Unannotated protein n=1 Tax=freshwater metagenome TaxID=449393 RepID=A0A6J6HFS6_9ZZZZ|nr:hypothetical protein [Rhodoluna sp.]MSZ95527.1 hypothetical protein [Actinomycetota bacterium]